MAVVSAKGSSEDQVEKTTPGPVSPTTTDDNDPKKSDDATNTAQQPKRSVQSLKERSRIPSSFFVTFGSILALQYLSGLYRLETLTSYVTSITTSARTIRQLALYVKVVTQEAVAALVGLESPQDSTRNWQDYAQVALIGALVFPCLYVFFYAPFRAGLWTGRRATKHRFHRFMGLAYLVQYTLAWVEMTTDYDVARNSVLPHMIAMNGILQASSAYISFKVLPELEDSGYLSDKAVMSRNFVHENIYFTLMCVFGSLYYYEPTRESLRSTLPGRILEHVFMFWPYIAIRLWYPITRFKDAGKTHKGRTDANLTFYKVATTMVKVFFLWAKYFLGFYMNFVIFLDLVPQSDTQTWRFLHGMLLLNTGTVSLAVFLHTLRFKKVLPPRVTMSIYLLQIYATFSVIPLAAGLFWQHPKLCAVAAAGLLCNMTRSRTVHGMWCLATMLLLNAPGIEW